MFNKYSESIRVVYLSKACSAAAFINALFILTSIIAPYVIIYKTQGNECIIIIYVFNSFQFNYLIYSYCNFYLGLWVRLERYQEQPKVMFKHDALLILETINAENKVHPLLWSTFSGLKGMINYELSPFIKVLT